MAGGGRVGIEPRPPGIRELVETMSSRQRVIIVLADRSHGRVFTWTEGTRMIEHLRTDARAELRGSRRAASVPMISPRGDAHERRHFVNIARRVARIHRAIPAADILFAGPEEDLAVLRLELSSSTRKAMIGTIDVAVDATTDEVAGAVAEFMSGDQHDFQRQLVDDLIEARKVGTAVIGLQPTIDAVSAGRAMLLVIDAGYGRRGQVEALFRRALETGCRIQLIRGDAALHLAGNIGAHLRPT